MHFRGLTFAHGNAFLASPALADLDGDGREEMLFTTLGHHRFALFTARFHPDGRISYGELRAGALRGIAVLPSTGPAGRPAFVVGRVFTAGREDLAAVLDPRFRDEGIYRVTPSGGSWEVSPLWVSEAAAGSRSSPEVWAAGGVGGEGPLIVAARMDWRRRYTHFGEYEELGGVFLVGEKGEAVWSSFPYRRFYWNAMGELDGDPAPEVCMYSFGALYVLGLSFPPPPSAPVPGGMSIQGHALSRVMDRVGLQALETVMELVDGTPAAEKLEKTFREIVGYGRFDLARALLNEWRGAAPASLFPVFDLIGADLSLLCGEYTAALEKYHTLSRVSPAPGRGLFSRGLPLAARRRLAERMGAGGGRVLLEERFEDPASAGEVLRPGGRAEPIERARDETGQYGGWYGRGAFAVLKATYDRTPVFGPCELASYPVPMPEPWDGRRPFRLSFLLYVKTLHFSDGLYVELRPPGAAAAAFQAAGGAAPAVSEEGGKQFFSVRFQHVRNSTLWEGDRFIVDGRIDPPPRIMRGRYVSEFPLSCWLRVTMEYVPSLAVAHLTVRHLDRDPRRAPPVARIDFTGVPPPPPGKYVVHFSLTRNTVDAVEPPMEMAVFLDEIRFEVF